MSVKLIMKTSRTPFLHISRYTLMPDIEVANPWLAHQGMINSSSYIFNVYERLIDDVRSSLTCLTHIPTVHSMCHTLALVITGAPMYGLMSSALLVCSK